LHQVSAMRKRPALIPAALEVSLNAREWLQSLCRRGLAAGDVEMVKLIVALVDFIKGKAADIINDQFGMIDQRQATSGGVTEKLVAQAAEDAGNDFRV